MREPEHHFLQLPGIPFWKRLIDLSFIIASAPLLLPLMAVISAVIKIASPGPALFRQTRIGYKGQPFMCFKFRTMKVNADTNIHQGHFNQLVSSNAPMKKLDARDSRVIPCGLILRTLGLDELPQIFNVLRGEMSLVGPRPCVPYEYQNYTPRNSAYFQPRFRPCSMAARISPPASSSEAPNGWQ